jgi:Family of unknown function (DUF5990)
MEHELRCSIILENPTAGVVFGLQKGGGNDYETIQKQKATGENLLFELNVRVKTGKNTAPVFLGPCTHGTPADRFIYIDIGTYAGQKESSWDRRLKIPFRGITPEMIQQLIKDPKLLLETRVSGIGKDGGPNCGTVKPFNGWEVRSSAK